MISIELQLAIKSGKWARPYLYVLDIKGLNRTSTTDFAKSLPIMFFYAVIYDDHIAAHVAYVYNDDLIALCSLYLFVEQNSIVAKCLCTPVKVQRIVFPSNMYCRESLCCRVFHSFFHSGVYSIDVACATKKFLGVGDSCFMPVHKSCRIVSDSLD